MVACSNCSGLMDTVSSFRRGWRYGSAAALNGVAGTCIVRFEKAMCGDIGRSISVMSLNELDAEGIRVSHTEGSGSGVHNLFKNQ